jgi:hypothetical protein
VRAGGRRAVAAAALTGAVCAAGPPAQPPTRKTSVESVEVDAIVTDEQDRFVRERVLFLSEGTDCDMEDITLQNPATASHRVREERVETIAAAIRSNVSIFSIDPRGLANPGDEFRVLPRAGGR